jgi:Baseplate J-like protein
MNGSCETPEQQLCGCCQGVGKETPEPISNRPGLSVIAYRVGTHSTFKASLLAALTSSSLPALAPLRTRDDSDFSIALLDAWATTLDILTFYQERIANESYLRTAVDTASVMGLAQLVGYRPSPGVAASAFLAFTLTSAPGSPDNVLIPTGTRVQSVPNPGQTPQVFETSADLTAVIAENAILPQATIPWTLNNNQQDIWLQGTTNNIHVGDVILFVSQGLYSQAATGASSGTLAFDYHFVTAVTIDSNSGNTLVTWDQPVTWPISNDNTAHVYVFRKKAALFGVQAPDPMSLPAPRFNNNIGGINGWPSSISGGGATAPVDWDFSVAFTNNAVRLDASYPGLSPQNGPPAWTLLTDPSQDPTVAGLYQVTAAFDTGFSAFTLSMKTTQLILANAQFQGIVLINPADVNFVLADFVIDTRSVTAYVHTDELTPADTPLTAWSYDGTYQRQTGMLQPVEGTQLDLLTGEQFANGQPLAISGQRLRLQVTAVDSQAHFSPAGSTGGLQLSAGQTFLVDAFPPAPASSGSDMVWSVITTDGVAGKLQIASANILLLPADQKNDPLVGESAMISNVTVTGSVVQLSFVQALSRIYDCRTVTVNANVVAATQGETMHEIMGSGDATNEALRLALKQSPLTYVSSSSGMGAASTLQVWVNNLRWHEVDNFLDSGPADRVFITQLDASQKTTVQFGDGQEGARTPTGQMNLRAVYRKGIGSAGNVQSGQLSQALDRPQGLKGVTNPDPATGGADPDTADTARVSAPLHVLTLDRVVSLEDYQNYALAFAGIAKALATWTWVGRMRSVFLTIAGANGIVFRQDDSTVTDLIKALHNAGNPFVPLQVAAYTPVLFEIGANLSIDTFNYDSGRVLAQVWQTLAGEFSFAQRAIGKGVAQSEILALIQNVPGVIAAQITALNLQRQAPSKPLPAVLQAASPIAGEQGTPVGAQLLLLDPASQGNLGVWAI